VVLPCEMTGTSSTWLTTTCQSISPLVAGLLVCKQRCYLLSDPAVHKNGQVVATACQHASCGRVASRPQKAVRVTLQAVWCNSCSFLQSLHCIKTQFRTTNHNS
jgi:hypothetical protein